MISGAGSATDVFAVGYNSTILHYGGNTWSSIDSGREGTFCRVWGSSATDVFVLANTLIRFSFNYNGESSITMGIPGLDDRARTWNLPQSGAAQESMYLPQD